MQSASVPSYVSPFQVAPPGIFLGAGLSTSEARAETSASHRRRGRACGAPVFAAPGPRKFKIFFLLARISPQRGASKQTTREPTSILTALGRSTWNPELPWLPTGATFRTLPPCQPNLQGRRERTPDPGAPQFLPPQPAYLSTLPAASDSYHLAHSRPTNVPYLPYLTVPTTFHPGFAGKARLWCLPSLPASRLPRPHLAIIIRLPACLDFFASLTVSFLHLIQPASHDDPRRYEPHRTALASIAQNPLSARSLYGKLSHGNTSGHRYRRR